MGLGLVILIVVSSANKIGLDLLFIIFGNLHKEGRAKAAELILVEHHCSSCAAICNSLSDIIHSACLTERQTHYCIPAAAVGWLEGR